MKTRLNTASKIFRSIFLSIILIATGYFIGASGYKAEVHSFQDVELTRELPPTEKDLDFNLFWRVWDTLHNKYLEKDQIVDSQLVYGAIQGMVAAVGDPYTVFLPPSDNKVVQEDLQGSFEGVGIQIGFKGSQLAVIAPLEDSPAEAAGVKAGDSIIGITDEAKDIDRGTIGINIQEAVQIIRGPAGTTVTLTLLREGAEEPIKVDIRRESINVPSVKLNYLDDQKSIAHVKLVKFSGDTLPEWEETVSELVKNPNLKGLILDVRNNPGGYLQGAVELSSDFLDTDETVVTEEDYSGAKRDYRVEKLGRLKEVELIVLVNEGSASASEILAGALRDNDRAVIIGDTTFGKGTIQEPQQIDSGAGLHITIAKWLTPKGTWVNEQGLEPDIKISDNDETEEDEQLDKALEEIRK